MILLDTGKRGWRVRFLQLVAIAFTVAMMAVAANLVFGPGTQPPDAVAAEGALLPLWQRLAVAAFLLALGGAAVAGMALYGTLYVTRLERAGLVVKVSTIGLFRARHLTIPLDDVVIGKRHEGKFGDYRTYHRVHAPWRALWLPGRRLPLLLDMQAPIVEPNAIARLARRKRRRKRA